MSANRVGEEDEILEYSGEDDFDDDAPSSIPVAGTSRGQQATEPKGVDDAMAD